MVPFGSMQPAQGHTLQSHEICWDRTINWVDFFDLFLVKPPTNWTIPIGILLSLACKPEIRDPPQSLRLCNAQVPGQTRGGWVDKKPKDTGFNVAKWLAGIFPDHQVYEDSFDKIIGLPWGFAFFDTQFPLIITTARDLIVQEVHDGATHFTHPSIFEFPSLRDRSVSSLDGQEVVNLPIGTNYIDTTLGNEKSVATGADETLFPVGGHKINRKAEGVRSDQANQFVSVIDIFPPKINVTKPVVIVEANTHWGFDPRLDLSELGEIFVDDECDPNPVLKWDGPDHILLEIIEPDNNVTNAWFAQDDGYDEYDYPESLSDVVTELLENSGRHDLLAADTKDLVVQVNQRVGESGLVKSALDSRLKLDKKIAEQDQIFKTKTVFSPSIIARSSGLGSAISKTSGGSMS